MSHDLSSKSFLHEHKPDFPEQAARPDVSTLASENRSFIRSGLPTLSCVVPCHNEADNLVRLLPLLCEELAECASAWEGHLGRRRQHRRHGVGAGQLGTTIRFSRPSVVPQLRQRSGTDRRSASRSWRRRRHAGCRSAAHPRVDTQIRRRVDRRRRRGLCGARQSKRRERVQALRHALLLRPGQRSGSVHGAVRRRRLSPDGPRGGGGPVVAA